MFSNIKSWQSHLLMASVYIQNVKKKVGGAEEVAVRKQHQLETSIM